MKSFVTLTTNLAPRTRIDVDVQASFELNLQEASKNLTRGELLAVLRSREFKNKLLARYETALLAAIHNASTSAENKSHLKQCLDN